MSIGGWGGPKPEGAFFEDVDHREREAVPMCLKYALLKLIQSLKIRTLTRDVPLGRESDRTSVNVVNLAFEDPFFYADSTTLHSKVLTSNTKKRKKKKKIRCVHSQCCSSSSAKLEPTTLQAQSLAR